MLAARGAMVVSRLGYGGCRSVRCRIDVSPCKRVGIKYPHPSHLFYNLSILPFAPEQIDSLPDRNSRVSYSRTRHFAVLSLSQAGHALVIHLSIMVALFLQRQRNDMDLLTGNISSLVLSAKDESAAPNDSEGVVGTREESGAGDSFESRAERLG